MPQLDSNVEVTEDMVREALKVPSDFGYSGSNDDMFATWSLGQIIRHRDSDVRSLSNAYALKKYLQEDPSLSEDWEVTGCSHWLVGWVDHLSFRAVEADGKTPTRIFRVLTEWFAALNDYPIADDEDYSRRMYEGAVENIEDIGGR